MNKIKKYFELSFLEEKMEQEIKFSNNKIVRTERLVEIYDIIGLQGYKLVYNVDTKYYEVRHMKEDEVFSVTSKSQQEIVEYINLILTKKEELDFKLNDYFLHIQSCDDGWDFTLFDSQMKELDGGQLDNPEMNILEARDTFINDFIEIEELKKAIPVLIEIEE